MVFHFGLDWMDLKITVVDNLFCSLWESTAVTTITTFAYSASSSTTIIIQHLRHLMTLIYWLIHTIKY